MMIRSFYKASLYLLLLLFFTACVPQRIFDKDAKNFSQRNFILKRAEHSPMYLSAKCLQGYCSFDVFDTFGIPILSRRYEDGEFKKLKSIPFNNSMDSIFLWILQNPNAKQKVFHIQSQAIFMESYSPKEQEEEYDPLF